MRPYQPGPLEASAISLPGLAAYVFTELKKLATMSRTPERELVGSVTVSIDYAASPGDAVVRVDATGNPVTVTLPLASSVVGQRMTVKRLNGGSNDVTVAASGSDLIDGAADVTLAAQYDTVTVVSVRDGTDYSWDIV